MGLPGILLRFLYPPPPSLFISAMSVISFASLTNAGLQEIKGKHMQYSKFFNVGASVSGDNKQKAEFSGRTGMLVAYIPAFLAGVASFALVPFEGLRFTLLRSALSIHFLKRLLEVLFVHKYSGMMEVETAMAISISYFLSTATMIYSQHLTSGLPEPPIDLKYFGILLFALGISGNFYHHYLLSRLRTEGDKKHKIPKVDYLIWSYVRTIFSRLLDSLGCLAFLKICMHFPLLLAPFSTCWGGAMPLGDGTSPSSLISQQRPRLSFHISSS